MNKAITYLLLIFLLAWGGSCKKQTVSPEPGFFQLLKFTNGQTTLSTSSLNRNQPIHPTLSVHFSSAVDVNTLKSSFLLRQFPAQDLIETNIGTSESNRVVNITPVANLGQLTTYTLTITEDLRSADGAGFPGIELQFETQNGSFSLAEATLNGKALEGQIIRDVPFDSIHISLTFTEPLDPQNFESFMYLSGVVNEEFTLINNATTVELTTTSPLDYYQFYTLTILDNLTAANGFEFDGFSATFQTGLNEEYKFQEISDDELLTKVQEATFGYFWDFAHPESGMARERNTSGNLVTTGGSGFGVMALLVGIERGFISRQEGINRLQKIVQFLDERADRYHGVWPHWMNGATGATIPFSAKDDGADLVETAFMAQGLITLRQYLNEANAIESALIDTINTMLSGIEWNWFTRNGQDVLYWLWSPNFGWDMNLRISGYNEALIVYVLAATSANYGIDAEVYHNGWARNGGISNGNTYYGFELPVGYGYGGPLFFTHYSFLGLDPRNLSDSYANYWTQNRNHSLIHQAYSIDNPKNYVGYNAGSWGLTASDDPNGYLAHEPNRDNGTLSPTGAISSMPYTPEESMQALRHYYYVLGDKLWGKYGFYDAFNPTQGWWADSYLAIDQGPIIVMIENYRTGLLWDLFMSAPEVQPALQKLGFNTSN